MNRKTLTILIATAVILIGGITFAVMKLYSDSRNDAGNAADSRFLETHKLVKAVPSDAALILATLWPYSGNWRQTNLTESRPCGQAA